jgi:putative FmdB family regulatory protein
MPVYEYECAGHGVFERSRPMAEASLPAPCPDCAVTAPRILSATNIPCLPSGLSRAHARNERSRHEPRRVEREPRRESSSAPRDPPRPMAAGGRPWAIGH